MTARQQADDELAEIWNRGGLPRRWTVPWARWSPAGTHRRISIPNVATIALGTLDGRPVVVSGSDDGTVRVWDLASGAPRGEPVRGHKGWVWSIALGTLDGRPVVVSGGRDGTVRVWDLASGAPRGEPLRGHDDWVSSVALGTLDGRPVVVSGGSDGTVRVWDEGGAVLSVRIGSSVQALAFAKLGAVAVGAARGLLLLQFEPEAITLPLAGGRSRA